MQTELLGLDSELWLFQLPHEVSEAQDKGHLLIPSTQYRSPNACLMLAAGPSSIIDLAAVYHS